jgi:PAS domain S-box-containing protein
MISDAHNLSARWPFTPSAGIWPKAALVAIAYFVGAEAAFLVGTLSDRIFAPFWPPNVILFCALLLAPRRHWWIYIAAAFPAHIIAEFGVGMPAPQWLVAFATNCTVAVLNAFLVQTALIEAPWLGNLRKAALYILITAVASPAVAALGGAFVPILGGGAADNYLGFWEQWYLSNALGYLTLGPIFLILCGERVKSLSSVSFRLALEAILLAVSLVVVCTLAFRSSGAVASGYIPALLYSPLPFILWSAIRFGEKGASAAILIVTIVLLWLTLNSSSLFIAGTREANVLALQIFLVSLSIPVLLLGASIDEARHAVRAIRESEERMSFAAASANVGLWYLESASGRLWATEYCRSMLGLAPDAPLTRATIVQAIHPDDRQSAIASIRSAAYSGEEVSAEFRIVRPDGGIRWFRARAHSDRDERGRPFRVSGIFADITASREAEHEADLQRRELAHLTRVSAMGQLSGAIAHELNQPLAAILSNAQAAQLMLESKSPNLADIRDTIDDIVTEDKRASEVIDRLRRLLRKDEGKFEPLDINELMASTLRLLHSEIVSRKINVTTNLAGDLPPAWGDGIQLQQVLLNLIMNAMDALASAPPARRIITLSTRRLSDDQVEISVSDLGDGLGPEGQYRALEPFFTTKPHGLGLGLSICSTIVNSHGGTLQLTNNAEGGARASFVLRTLVPNIAVKA